MQHSFFLMPGKSPRAFENLCGDVGFNCVKTALLDQGEINTSADHWLGGQEKLKDLLPVTWFQLETILGDLWGT